jgi:hypothetical protein
MRHKSWTIPTFLGFLFLAAMAQTAKADTYNIAWSGPYGPGSGTVTADNLGGGIFQLSAIDGTQDGIAISLLPQFTYGVNGNLIYPSQPIQLDDFGFGFLAGSTEYNIYFDDVVTGVFRECSSADTACPDFGDGQAINSFSISAPTAPVPEPSSLILLGSGLIGLAGAVRRKLSR